MANNNLHTYLPESVSIPGASIQDIIDELGMAQAELAERMGIHKKTLNEIIKGKNPITPDTALLLERVLNTPASFWLKREQGYREYIARKKDYEKLAVELSFLKEVPIKEMIGYGWVNRFQNKVRQLSEIYSYYAVASESECRALCLAHNAQYRISQHAKKNQIVILTWLRHGEIKFRDFRGIFDEQKFKANLTTIRLLALENPADGSKKLKELCEDAGVALVFTPPLKNSGISGAVRWINQTPLIQMSNRWKQHDHFWFTFFHEAAHIILKHGKKCFIEYSKGGGSTDKEAEADSYASDFLIPSFEYMKFKQEKRQPNADSIISFARKIKVHPGIVVGRLQHDKIILPSYLNELKLRWEINMD